MPILKDIAGHGGTAGIRRYLEKGDRALARDVMNLPMEEWVGEAPGEHSIIVEWDVEMDRTREAYGTNAPWRGLDARTFEHFVISLDPEDGIDLDALRQLSRAWVVDREAWTESVPSIARLKSPSATSAEPTSPATPPPMRKSI